MLRWLNLQNFWSEFLFQKVLLKVQESLFVVDLLPHLNNCIPIMWRKIFFTVRTLCINLNEFDHLCLFNLNFVIDIFSDIYFDFEPFRVRLSPYEFGIEEMNFVESLDFFE